MWQSCGGVQALNIATSDPRISTAVILNSGAVNGTLPRPAGAAGTGGRGGAGGSSTKALQYCGGVNERRFGDARFAIEKGSCRRSDSDVSEKYGGFDYSSHLLGVAVCAGASSAAGARTRAWPGG